MKKKLKLTNTEWNTLQKLLTSAGLDGIFWLVSKKRKDYIYAEDPDDCNKMIKESLAKGCEEIIDALGLSLEEEGLNTDEINTLINLWDELGVLKGYTL